MRCVEHQTFDCGHSRRPQNHPLRQCAQRLKIKAERLLKNITDCKERLDPHVPAELPSSATPPRLNGTTLNGHGRSHTPSTTQSPGPPIHRVSMPPSARKPRKDLSFPEAPAIVRTPAGMAHFLQLDQQMMSASNDNLGGSSEEAVSQLAPGLDDDGNMEVGMKRKLYVDLEYDERHITLIHLSKKRVCSGSRSSS